MLMCMVLSVSMDPRIGTRLLRVLEDKKKDMGRQGARRMKMLMLTYHDSAKQEMIDFPNQRDRNTPKHLNPQSHTRTHCRTEPAISIHVKCGWAVLKVTREDIFSFLQDIFPYVLHKRDSHNGDWEPSTSTPKGLYYSIPCQLMLRAKMLTKM